MNRGASPACFASVLHAASAVYSRQTKGQPRRICPSEQLVATSTSICTGFLRYSVRTRAHANMLLGKARGGPPTPREGRSIHPNGKLPLPKPGCSGSLARTCNQGEKAAIKGLCRSPPRRGDLVAVAGDARVPALVTVPRRPLPRARKAAQRQPAARASSDNVLRRDRRLHVRQRRHGRAQVQVPAARRGAPDEYQT